MSSSIAWKSPAPALFEEAGAIGRVEKTCLTYFVRQSTKEPNISAAKQQQKFCFRSRKYKKGLKAYSFETFPFLGIKNIRHIVYSIKKDLLISIKRPPHFEVSNS